MILSGTFSYPGRYRSFLPEHRMDAVQECNCGEHRAVVLCSGSGPRGKAAAELTAQAAAGFLTFRFSRCLLEEPEVLQQEMAQIMSQVPVQSDCTLLAAAMDQRGHFCAFHLGDGTLLGKLETTPQWAVISPPQPCPAPGSAARTGNSSLFGGLRFYRVMEPGGHRLFLAGKGVAELIAHQPALLNHPERLGELILRAEQGQPQALPELSHILEDDCSAAWLSVFPWV